jgi:hypothetical protein
LGVELKVPDFGASRLLAIKLVCTSATMLGGAAAFAQPDGLTPCSKGVAAVTCSGTFRFPDGVIYYGEFRDGRRHGVGAFVFPDGRRQVHEFESDAVSGQGIRYRADGSIENSGTFAYGQLVRAHPVGLQIFDRRAPIPSDPPARPQMAGPQDPQTLASYQAVSAMTVDGRTLPFVLGAGAPSDPVTGTIPIFDIIDANGRSSIKIIPRSPG